MYSYFLAAALKKSTPYEKRHLWYLQLHCLINIYIRISIPQ